MIRYLIRAFMDLNIFVIRASRGRIGTLLANQTILLLHTVGCKSGRQIITPISYFQADGCYFLIGSNWGKKKNAAWYYNLLDQPRTTIEVRGREIQVETRQAEGPEYDQLWNQAIQRYPPYMHYKKTTQRHIPIMVLKPVAS